MKRFYTVLCLAAALFLRGMPASPSLAGVDQGRANQCIKEMSFKEALQQYGANDVTIAKFKLNNQSYSGFVIVIRYGDEFDVLYYTPTGCLQKGLRETHVDDAFIHDIEKNLSITILDPTTNDLSYMNNLKLNMPDIFGKRNNKKTH